MSEVRTVSFDENIHSTGQQIDDPEKKLWAAVLIQAIEDLRLKITPEQLDQTNKVNEYLKNQAKGYFKSKRINEGSFLWICDLFDIDPVLARNAILNGSQNHTIRK